MGQGYESRPLCDYLARTSLESCTPYRTHGAKFTKIQFAGAGDKTSFLALPPVKSQILVSIRAVLAKCHHTIWHITPLFSITYDMSTVIKIDRLAIKIFF